MREKEIDPSDGHESCSQWLKSRTTPLVTGDPKGTTINKMSDAARKEIHALVDELPEERLSEVRRVLEEEVRGNGSPQDTRSALDKAEVMGLVGCLDGDAPTDLASNPAHMAGFGQ